MITFRPADLTNEGERIFVVSSWSASYKQSKTAGLITDEDWPKVMHDQIGKILARPASTVILGVDDKSPTFFYGWIAGDKSGRVPVVYYCYVKEPYRRNGYENGVRVGDGYGRRFLRAFGLEGKDHFLFSCMTPVIQDIGAKIPRARWEPAAARYADSVHKSGNLYNRRRRAR